MGNLDLFLKSNKKKIENQEYAVTKSLCDETGEPLKWKLRAVTTKESERIREACTREVQVPGKKNMYRQKFDSSAYTAKIVCAAIVYPDLENKELQDSYGVMSPEELVQEMVDNPEEYSALLQFINDMSGLSETLEDDVDKVKN